VGQRLTARLVAAARARMEAAGGLLSLRQALLYDRRAGLTDLDVGRFCQRGEELRARGAHEDDADVTAHDRLCLELVNMDSARASRTLLYAGEAATRILTSREPKMAGHQVALIKHTWDTFGEVGSAAVLGGTTERRDGLDVPQADMDLMTDAELRLFEADVRVRAEAAARIASLVATVRRRASERPIEADVVH
jgi:hypothetical protein